MKFLSTLAGVIVFILFFGFALKNTQEVDLHFSSITNCAAPWC